MLTAYLTQTRRLLQLPAAPTTLYTDADLTSYINTARSQLAGEGQCIRSFATQATVAGTNNYLFSGFTIAAAVANGIAGVIHVRSLAYQIGSGQRWIPPRAWEWFNFYVLNDPLSGQSANWGPPAHWAQYQQGTQPVAGTTMKQGGSLYINVPDDIYTLVADAVCYPLPLAVDGDPEAIPFMWTDAVPYFAAYYALLSSQMQARLADALRYYEIYQEFVKRAREAANPDPMRYQYEQATDITLPSKFGMKPQAGGQA